MLSLAMAASSLILTATAGGAATQPSEPDPAKMSQSEIRAFNATVSKDHPYFIRCKRSVSTGSFVRGSTSCRTNAQWAIAMDRGNQQARDLVESTAKGYSNGS